MTNTKQEAFDLFEQKRHEFLENCRWVARRLCKEKGHVTTDDIRKECPLPLGIDGRVYGAVFAGEEWEKTGTISTKIKASHGRPISVFVLKGHDHPTWEDMRKQSEHLYYLGQKAKYEIKKA